MKLIDYLENIDKIKIPVLSDGESETIDNFFNNCIRKLLPSNDTIYAWDKLLNKYVNEDTVIFFIRKYNSDPNNNWENLRRGFYTKYNNNFGYVYCDNFLAHYFYLMAIDNYIPEYNDFYQTIMDRNFPHGFRETSEEKPFRAFHRGKTVGINKAGWKLAHIFSVNGNDYNFDYKQETKTLFPIREQQDWHKHNNSTYPYREINREISIKERNIMKAHFLRLVHPINYFLVPKSKYIVGCNNNIGEYPELIQYIYLYNKKNYPDIFDQYEMNTMYKKSESLKTIEELGNIKINIKYEFTSKSTDDIITKEKTMNYNPDKVLETKPAESKSKLSNENDFRSWMVRKEKIRRNTASSYVRAINEISRHYSENKSKTVDMFKINELDILKNIEGEYKKRGKYEEFGRLKHNLYTAAIAKYVKFIEAIKSNDDISKTSDIGIKNIQCFESNNKKEFEKWMIERYEPSTVASYKSSINTILHHYHQQTNKRIDLYNINDMIFIDGLVKDYGIGGKYQGIGEKGKGNVRCAIAAYERFLKQKRLGYDSQLNKKDLLKDNNQKSSIQNNISEQSIPVNGFEFTNKAHMIILPVLAFMIILPVLSKYIARILLKKNENNWWKKYVLDKLRETRDLPQNGSKEEYINELDISACLNIIIYNWDEIFKHEMDIHSRDLAHSLLSIRNKETAHYTTKILTKYRYADTDYALGQIIHFMRPIDSNIAEQISKIKQEFESKYKNEN